MNPYDPAVQTLARTLAIEMGLDGPDADEPIAGEYVRIAMAQLFELAKTGVRLVYPDDVIESDADTESHTVKLLLKAE